MKLKKLIAALLVLTLIMAMVPVASAATVTDEIQGKVFKGVDLSRWNGAVDFKVLKSRGVDFVILRCYSYGKDLKFDEYYEGARQAGLDIGAYVYMYATSSSSAIKEANAAISALGGKQLDYPLFLDIEDSTVKKLSKSTLTTLSITELELFRKAGYVAGIYCSKSFQSDYLDMSRLSDYYLWTAKWSLYSNEHDGKKYYFKDMDPFHSSRPVGEMWQFTSGGYGPYYGMESRYLDLDYCYIDFKNKFTDSASKEPSDYTYPQRLLSYNSSSMMKGTDVSWVQAVLCQLDYIEIVDGVYGPATKSAVTKFQKNTGLAESGTVDTQTAEKLLDVYTHKSFKAKLRYDPNNSGVAISMGTIDYGTAFTLGSDMVLKNEGYYLSGWTLYRASDKKYYCTNGSWHTASKISGGKYFKKIFTNGQKFSISEFILSSSDIKSDTITFTAVWETQKNAKYVIYDSGTQYSVYYGTLTYQQAEDFCRSRGGSLAVIDSAKLISLFSATGKNDKLYTGGKKIGTGWLWQSGAKVTLPVTENESGESAYLTLTAKSLEEPHSLYAVSETESVSGFIMEMPCTHDNITIKNYKDTACAVDGYSGDKVCSDCGTVIQKGTSVRSSGHEYSAYVVTKAATCKETGVKERVCGVCGKISTKTIAKTENHVFKTTVAEKASTEKNGKATDKCTVCGYVNKEYKVSKIKSVTLTKTSMEYTGEKLMPGVIVKDKSGNALSEGTDYKVSYSSNKYVGKATVKVSFKGRYEGTVTKTFKILPQATAFTSSSSKSKTVTLKWSRISHQSTGYYLEYSPVKDFSSSVKSVRIKSNKTLTKTVKSLKKGKVYYFRIRTYRTLSSGTNYYSAWSKIKKVTVK